MPATCYNGCTNCSSLRLGNTAEGSVLKYGCILIFNMKKYNNQNSLVFSLFYCFNILSRLVIGEGNGTPLQYSCLENPMDGGAW